MFLYIYIFIIILYILFFFFFFFFLTKKNKGVINVLSFDDLLNNDKGVQGKDSESTKVIDKIMKINTYGNSNIYIFK